MPRVQDLGYRDFCRARGLGLRGLTFRHWIRDIGLRKSVSRSEWNL